MIQINEKEIVFTLEDYAQTAALMYELLSEEIPEDLKTEEHEEIDTLIRMYVVMSDTIVSKANFPEKTVFVNTMN